MDTIFISIGSMVGLGVFFAVILAFADKTMHIEEDARISAIEEILPGLNCGACGYTGCHSYAVSLSKGDASITACLPGGDEVAGRLAEFLGFEKGKVAKSIAILHCNADFDRRNKTADYKGIETCQAAVAVSGGGVACVYGCLGYGDCAGACPFGAIKMANGLPVVDSTRCTACGRCVSACPRGLYTVERFTNGAITAVACSSPEKAAIVRDVCGVGCIGCKLCEKLSGGIFEVKDNLASVNYKKARPDTDWDKVIEKCPTKVIVKIV